MNITEIRHHIHAVRQTQQITRAMYLIATSKLRRAMDRNLKNATYFSQVRNVLRDILAHSKEIRHPYLEERTDNRVAFIVIAADKGLAGGYNHRVLQLAEQEISKHPPGACTVFTVGQMAREHFARRGQAIDVEFLHIIQNPALFHAREIAATLMSLYDPHMLDEVYVVYTHLKSSAVQEPVAVRLLPLRPEDFQDAEEEETSMLGMVYEPSVKELFNTLAPQYVIGQLYGVLVQSFASEQCARMNAMESATRNADEMLKALEKKLQRARQASITQEISEIMAGASALNKEASR